MWLEQFPIVVCLIQMYSYPLLYSEAHWYPARLFAGGGGMKSCAVFLSLFDFIPEQSPKGKMASSWDTRFCQNTYRGLIRFLVIPEFLELNLNSKHSLVNYIQSYGIIELYPFEVWLLTQHSLSHVIQHPLSHLQWQDTHYLRGSHFHLTVFLWELKCIRNLV